MILNFMSDTKVISSKNVFSSKNFTVLQKVIERNNKTFTKDIIERKSNVLIIPYTENEMYIEEQYRDALEKVTLEIVQGTIETDEDLLESAKRELHEETGLTAKKWTKIADWDLSAIMKMKLHVFAATDLEEGKQQLDFDEEIKITKLPIEEVINKIEKGEIITASHIAAILLFDRLRKEGKL
jgi:ADP-ribose pyrophosphatase